MLVISIKDGQSIFINKYSMLNNGIGFTQLRRVVKYFSGWKSQTDLKTSQYRDKQLALYELLVMNNDS